MHLDKTLNRLVSWLIMQIFPFWKKILYLSSFKVQILGFPGGPMVRTQCFHCWDLNFQSLVRELLSHKLHGVASKRNKYCNSCYLRAYYMLDACTTFVLYKIVHLSFCSNPDLQISKLKLWYFKQLAKNCINGLISDLIFFLWPCCKSRTLI